VWAIGQLQLKTGAVTRVPKTKMFPLFTKIQAPAPRHIPGSVGTEQKGDKSRAFGSWTPLFPRRGQSFPQNLWNVMDKRGIPSS
jgi:hypothetical protein